MKNISNWSSSATQPMRSAKTRPPRPPVQHPYQPPPPVVQAPLGPLLPALPPNPPRHPLTTQTQALHSTYASRSKTGVTLLVQPILAQASASHLRASRRTVNYTEPGSGDEFPDAGAIESDDSDFVASGGTRMSIRQSRSRMATGMNVFNATTGSSSTPRPAGATPKPDKLELDKSYLGMIPPAQAIQARLFTPTAHEFLYVISLHTFPIFQFITVLSTPSSARRKEEHPSSPFVSNSKQRPTESATALCGTSTRC
jgi:chromatin structure-remodeling complex subunit SFH1